MEKRWRFLKHDYELVKSLSEELGVPPLTAALLISRGFDTSELAQRFLSPSIEHLHDPEKLKGLTEAVVRIKAAIAAGEKIMIWGDYDVDGTTGTVLLRHVLRLLGSESEFHIPNRFTEGYGINIPALEAAKARGVSLVISVDCGIRSFEPLEWARDNGLDFIVTDHHLTDPVNGNPPALAIVNPNQTDCEYPDKQLAGVGVAYKLAQALLRSAGREDEVRTLLAIAAVGTIADVMKLTGENRAIVALGLKDLPNVKNWGLKALMEAADCTSEMTSYDIGFRIAPRINAAGRMDVATTVVELFEADDFAAARKLAGVLDSRNRERQKVQQQITEMAILEGDVDLTRRFVVVAGEGWHRGVIGLAASRIAERLHRPSIVLSIEDGVAHGSARSVGDFHLLNALESCSDLFDQFGGHAAAAGMKIRAENIEELKRRLHDYAVEEIAIEETTPELVIDALVTAKSLNMGLHSSLKVLEPFGAGNVKPVFSTRGLRLRYEPRVMKDKHLKLYLEDDENRRFEAVWWDGVSRSEGRTLDMDSSIEVAYTLDRNEWQGNVSLQLVVQDVRTDN